MIALGVLHSPLDFCERLRQDKVKYSVNCIDRQKIAVFIGLEPFTALRKRNIPRKLLIFDAQERLAMIEGLYIVKNKSLNAAYTAIRVWEKPSPTLTVKNHDYVAECISKNKDVGFLHTYNTNLYNISFSPTRDKIRNVYLSFLNGELNRAKFDKEMESLYPKRGKSLEAVDALMELASTDVFIRMQKCIQEAKGKSPKEIDAFALKYDVETFDLRYLLSTLKT